MSKQEGQTTPLLSNSPLDAPPAYPGATDELAAAPYELSPIQKRWALFWQASVAIIVIVSFVDRYPLTGGGIVGVLLVLLAIGAGSVQVVLTFQSPQFRNSVAPITLVLAYVAIIVGIVADLNLFDDALFTITVMAIPAFVAAGIEWGGCLRNPSEWNFWKGPAYVDSWKTVPPTDPQLRPLFIAYCCMPLVWLAAELVDDAWENSGGDAMVDLFWDPTPIGVIKLLIALANVGIGSVLFWRYTGMLWVQVPWLVSHVVIWVVLEAELSGFWGDDLVTMIVIYGILSVIGWISMGLRLKVMAARELNPNATTITV